MEISFLRGFFKDNGYPKALINIAISKFLDKRLTSKVSMYHVEKLEKYYVLPFEKQCKK